MSLKRLIVSVGAFGAALDRGCRLRSGDDDTTAEAAADTGGSAVRRRGGRAGEHHRQRAAHRSRLAWRDLQERPGPGRRIRRRRLQTARGRRRRLQAQQIQQVISEKPDVLVVLPQDGESLTPVAAAGRGRRDPGRQHRPPVHPAGRGDGDDPRRQLPDRNPRGRLHRRTAQMQRQRRRDPGPGRDLGHPGTHRRLHRRAEEGLPGRRHRDRRPPAGRLRPGQGPDGDGEHPPVRGPDRRRLHP